MVMLKPKHKPCLKMLKSKYWLLRKDQKKVLKLRCTPYLIFVKFNLKEAIIDLVPSILSTFNSFGLI